MNKHIKEKKKIKMQNKEIAKQISIFSKQFPHLSVICSFWRIDIADVKKIYKMVNNVLNREEFQSSLHMILVMVHEGASLDRFKENSQFKYYWSLYKSLGITFKDNKGNIRLKLI